MKTDMSYFGLLKIILICLIMITGQPTFSLADSAQEKIINKDDADYIFSLTRKKWEAYTQRMVHPDGWKVRFLPISTGTGVMSYDPNSGMSLTVQPLYRDNINTPDFLIVGSYYSPGTLPNFTDEYKKHLEDETMRDLGANYSVSASYVKGPSLEGIELMISKR